MSAEALEERRAYSVAEVATMYGLSRQSVYKEIQDGRLAALKIRGRTVVTSQALDEWLEGSR
jgi:excisionase family DNA binding protein